MLASQGTLEFWEPLLTVSPRTWGQIQLVPRRCIANGREKKRDRTFLRAACYTILVMTCLNSGYGDLVEVHPGFTIYYGVFLQTTKLLPAACRALLFFSKLSND